MNLQDKVKKGDYRDCSSMQWNLFQEDGLTKIRWYDLECSYSGEVIETYDVDQYTTLLDVKIPHKYIKYNYQHDECCVLLLSKASEKAEDA